MPGARPGPLPRHLEALGISLRSVTPSSFAVGSSAARAREARASTPRSTAAALMLELQWCRCDQGMRLARPDRTQARVAAAGGGRDGRRAAQYRRGGQPSFCVFVCEILHQIRRKRIHAGSIPFHRSGGFRPLLIACLYLYHQPPPSSVAVVSSLEQLATRASAAMLPSWMSVARQSGCLQGPTVHPVSIFIARSQKEGGGVQQFFRLQNCIVPRAWAGGESASSAASSAARSHWWPTPTPRGKAILCSRGTARRPAVGIGC